MSIGVTGQVKGAAAEIYEDFFVPALFQEWTKRVTDAANIQPGQRVLDVACGTGVLAREAAKRVGGAGAVVGIDLNEGMLAVASRIAPEIEWTHGRAESLPFEDENFDAVVSQFGLMFFADRPAALREMWRVLRPGARMAVAVWDALDTSPGYAAMTALLRRLFGDDVADALRAPFCLGNSHAFASLFAEAGIPGVSITTRNGVARFPSIQAWVYTDIKGWTLADAIDDDQFAVLLREAEREFSRFVTEDGHVEFSAPAHIGSATKA